MGHRALRQLRALVEEERQTEAANARFVQAFLKYGIIIMPAVIIVLAYLLGVF